MTTDYGMYRFEDDIKKLERKIASLKKYKLNMKTMLKHLSTRWGKCNLTTICMYAKHNLDFSLEKINEFFPDIEDAIQKAIENLERSIEIHGDTYSYSSNELIKKGHYPNIWLFHGGFMGGRGVIIKPNQHSRNMYPILLEDFKKLKEIKDKRRLTRGDVEPVIEKFKKLNFNQKQENYANCYNEHLKVDTERRYKFFEERVVHIEHELALIDRNPSREWKLKEDLKHAEEYRKQCAETLRKLQHLQFGPKGGL